MAFTANLNNINYGCDILEQKDIQRQVFIEGLRHLSRKIY